MSVVIIYKFLVVFFSLGSFASFFDRLNFIVVILYPFVVILSLCSCLVSLFGHFVSLFGYFTSLCYHLASLYSSFCVSMWLRASLWVILYLLSETFKQEILSHLTSRASEPAPSRLIMCAGESLTVRQELAQKPPRTQGHGSEVYCVFSLSLL